MAEEAADVENFDELTDAMYELLRKLEKAHPERWRQGSLYATLEQMNILIELDKLYVDEFVRLTRIAGELFKRVEMLEKHVGIERIEESGL